MFLGEDGVDWSHTGETRHPPNHTRHREGGHRGYRDTVYNCQVTIVGSFVSTEERRARGVGVGPVVTRQDPPTSVVGVQVPRSPGRRGQRTRRHVLTSTEQETPLLSPSFVETFMQTNP